MNEEVELRNILAIYHTEKQGYVDCFNPVDGFSYTISPMRARDYSRDSTEAFMYHLYSSDKHTAVKIIVTQTEYKPE